MNLVGKKVILRAIEEKDLEISRETTNNPNVEASIIGWSVPISKKNQIDWFKNEHNTFTNIRYVIATKENDEAIGMIGLYNIDWKNGVVPSFGLKIFNTNNRKRGLAFDALMTLLKYVFYELRLNRVEYKTLYFNKAALNVVAKAGFQIEGEKREAVYKNGKFNNVITGGCLKSDYEKKLEETHYWDENFDTVNPPPIKNKCTLCMHIQEHGLSIKFLKYIIKSCDCAFKVPILSRINSKNILNNLSQNAVIIYVSEIDILGYIAFYANDKNSKQAYISLVAVKPEMQNLGIGKSLLNECIYVSYRYGMNKIALKVDKDNKNAIKFYLKNGFNLKNEDNKQYLMEKYIG